MLTRLSKSISEKSFVHLCKKGITSAVERDLLPRRLFCALIAQNNPHSSKPLTADVRPHKIIIESEWVGFKCAVFLIKLRSAL